MKMRLLSVVAMGALLFVGCAENTPTKEGAKKMPTRFQSVKMSEAQLLQEGQQKMFCPSCGMNLPMFYKTNHSADVDGKTHQFCSIHCLAETMSKGKKVEHIQVVDNSSLKFIDASKAWYVVGSQKAGTMSKVSKYAFATKEDAQKFAKANSGKVMNFNATLALVKKSLTKETEMIHKKQGMMAKKGEAMYGKLCKPIDQKFTSVASAKSYIKEHKSCGELNGKQLQAIGLYLKSK